MDHAKVGLSDRHPSRFAICGVLHIVVSLNLHEKIWSISDKIQSLATGKGSQVRRRWLALQIETVLENQRSLEGHR